MIDFASFRVTWGLLAWVLASLSTHAALAQPSMDSSPITVGIDGHYRVGCWTAIKVNPAASQSRAAIEAGNELGVETLDGDGVRVVYQQTKSFADGEFGYAVPGSEAAPLIVRNQQANWFATRFPVAGVPAKGPSMIPRGMPWVIVIGDPLGIDQIGANELLNRPASVAVTMPRSSASFPNKSIGYEGVDAVLINGSGAPVLSAFQPTQQRALKRWLLGGGRLILTLGESSTALIESAPWLSELLPSGFGELKTTTIDPSALEAYTSTQVRLEPFVGVDLPRDLGQIIVLGRTTRKVSTPVVVDYVVGLGRVTVIAADLDSEAFAAWPERLDLVTRLTGDLLVSPDTLPGQKSLSTSYSDLSGQLKAALDQFSMKRKVRFSLISLIMLALIALVGPLDYLLVNRLLGRPLLGWFTFPIVAIGLSLFLVWQSEPVVANPNAASSSSQESGFSDDAPVQCNRVEFVDMDLASGIGRGMVWSYLYTHEARQIALRSESTDALAQLASAIPVRLLSPFGYPGRSLGGIQIVGDDSRMPTYEVTLSDTTDEFDAIITQLALAPRSSKSIVANYQFVPNLPTDLNVKRRRGSELLEGSVTNPLPFDLLDGMLIYRNWAYLLPTRFRAGAAVDSVDSLRQKNFRWQLSRQRAVGSSSETQVWNPADIQSVNRIAEMLMFHDAVGGRRYTRLGDEVLGDLDLSSLLVDDRCILLGRLDTPLSRLSIAPQSDADATADESSRRTFPETSSQTWLRLVIPVQATSRY